MTETRDNAAIVHDLDGAFNVHDLDRVAAMVSENLELVGFAADGQVFRGPESFSQWHLMFLGAVPDAKVDLTNVVAAGEGGWVFTETSNASYQGCLLSTYAHLFS